MQKGSTQVLYPRCAGLDIRKDIIVACVRCVSVPEHHEAQSFCSTTKGLLALPRWLAGHGCSHVAMEATGVYWKPVWYIVEGSFEVVLGNAALIRNVPGRKTDVNDAIWIVDLLANGLIRSSFAPPDAIQELHDLTRTCKQLTRKIAQDCLRIQKVLEDANLKLGSVLADVLGGSGRAILKTIISGEDDPVLLAALAQGHARKKMSELREALRGRITSHHRAMLALHLQLIDALEHALTDLDAAVGLALTPIRQHVQLLRTIPGVVDLAARVLVAEIGGDMTRFPDSAHLIPWAGLYPRNDESPGSAAVRASAKAAHGSRRHP